MSSARRALPLLAAVLALAGVGAMRPGAETGACAQGTAVVPRADCDRAGGATTLEACAATTQSFLTVGARPSGRGVRFAFTRRVARPVRIDVFQSSAGTQVIGQRLVARFANRRRGFWWSGRSQRGRRAVRDGVLFARFVMRDERGRVDTRRLALSRFRGRFRVRRDFYRRTSCGTLTSFKLRAPVFGGSRRRALGIAFRLVRAGTVAVEVRRAGRVVRRYRATPRSARATHRLILPVGRLRRGLYEVRMRYTGDRGSFVASLYAQRL